MADPFVQLIGQQQAVELLVQAVKKNRISPAYLFVGPEGVGRSLAARCFTELLFTNESNANFIRNQLQNANHPDLLWVEPTYHHQGQLLNAAQAADKGIQRQGSPLIRLEQIRQITEFVSRPPLEAPRHIVVIEQAETIAEAAANALLKTLEEPGQATIILIAPSVESILPTLVSRCQRILFRCLDTVAMASVLKRVGYQEILQNPVILSIAAGSPGKAIAAYKQMQNIPLPILQTASQIPKNYIQALELAREIDKSLDTEAQLWLIDFLQHFYWQNWRQASIINQLEQARKFLLAYAQPRLIWECTFLQLCQLQADVGNKNKSGS
jgi:DNA polymerase-3 subunit delta'